MGHEGLSWGARGIASPRLNTAGRDAGALLKSPALLAAAGAAALVPIFAHVPLYHAPSLQSAIDTTITLNAFAVAWLLRAQFARSRRYVDLMMFGAVGMLALMHLCLSMLPGALDFDSGARQFRAAAVWGQPFVAVLFALAAFASWDRRVVRSRYAVPAMLALSVVAVGLATAGGFLLPSAIFELKAGSDALWSGPAHHPVGLAVVLMGTLLLASAALSPAAHRAPASAGQPSATATAAACLAAACAYQLLLATPASGQLALTDLPTAAAVGIMLVATVRGERRARARIARAAALAERRRVAQDLHDGLAQDLAFIAAHESMIADGMGDQHPIVIAARRALAISRRTISELSDAETTSVRDGLEAVAQELRERFDIAVAVDSQVGDDLAPDVREHLSRIAREAIANAARHGGARNVILSLTRLERAYILRVVDDGCGICDSDGSPAPPGFGIRSMSDRAAALGGYLEVHQPRWGGTELEVVFR